MRLPEDKRSIASVKEALASCRDRFAEIDEMFVLITTDMIWCSYYLALTAFY
jgi:hypothetical protein